MTDEHGIHTGSVLRTGPASDTSAAAVADGLRRFSRRVDEGGFAEEQIFLPTSAGRIFVTLVEPRGAQRRVAFLACHPFAWEQLELFPLELAFARAAAASGFPVAIFHARGYGDSGGDLAQAGLGTQVRDATAVGRFLLERTGAEALVPVGVRFGASVAFVTARELRAPGAALWEPALEPGRYLDVLLKAFSMSRVMEETARSGGKRRGVREMKAALAAGESVDVFGYPVGPEGYAEAHASRLLEGPGHVPPRALLVAVNPARRGSAEKLTGRLTEMGSEARFEDADGPGRSEFGLGMPVGGHLARHQALFDDMARRTIGWAREAW